MAKDESKSKTAQEMRKIDGMKALATALSFMIYLAVIMYMEYHFLNLISSFLGSGSQIVGYVVVGASFLTAIALPLGLHYWFREGTQKYVGLIFYGLHFVIMFLNLVLDSNATKYGVHGNEFHGFLEFYGVWVLPGYIAFYGLAWSVLWFSDDGSKAIDMKRNAAYMEDEAALNRRMSVAELQSTALGNAFQSPAAKTAINKWAAKNAPSLLAAELGMTLDELGVSEQDDFRFWTPDLDQNGIPDMMEDKAPAVPFRRPPPQTNYVQRTRANGAAD